MESFERSYRQLVAAGFNNSEIREFFSASNAPMLFGTEPFKAMLKSRAKWFRGRLKAGWNRQQVWGSINRYYANKKHSPWDFVRIEYRPPLRVDQKTYREAARRRAVKVTKSLYGKSKINKPAYHLLKTKPRQPFTTTLKGKRVTF